MYKYKRKGILEYTIHDNHEGGKEERGEDG